MKLMSVKLARSVWFVNSLDLNPRGKYLGAITPSLISKYRFLKFPARAEDLDFSKGVKFEDGSFQRDEETEIVVSLTLYNDGILADTRSSTRDSDIFLDNFLTWAVTELKLTPYQDVLKSKAYLSELFVLTDKSLNTINPKLKKFIKLLTSKVNHPAAEFETTGISFWAGPSPSPAGPFRFERAAEAPLRENRFYSAAPLQTDDHIALLEELENILAG